MNILPIGTHSFPVIRREQFLYVDKTAQLERLVRNGRSYFLSRPPGYGKSLLLSTLTAMFSGQTALFKGLAAENRVREYADSPYPVININLSSLETENAESAEYSLHNILSTIAKKFSIELEKAPVRVEVAFLMKYMSSLDHLFFLSITMKNQLPIALIIRMNYLK